MSTYDVMTKHPTTNEWLIATWLDDYFGHHNYGVRFHKYPESVWRADSYPMDTNPDLPLIPIIKDSNKEDLQYDLNKTDFPSILLNGHQLIIGVLGAWYYLNIRDVIITKEEL